MSTKDTIIAKLTEALSPTELVVIDESDKHKGHGGWREGGETHFRVQIVAEAFSGMNRVNRHRTINDLLADELAAGVHALALEIRSPDEPDPRAARRAQSPS
ncbi:BolA family protein [Roseibium sp.]|uniref:BolA family protein n=1 Tax=Roseibium sp. TaxID=1936156 RepID=UPI003A96CBA6